MTRLMTQVELRKKEVNGYATVTCWLDVDSRIKEGKQITIKDEDGWWTVHKVYDTMDRADAPTKWDVGGLEGKHVNQK